MSGSEVSGSDTSGSDTSGSRMVRPVLQLIMVAILVVMGWLTLQASLDRHVFDNGPLMADGWFRVTLCDAYCGFLIFYCWVFYKELTWMGRLSWFAAIMLLGNFAMATYVLIQLRRWDPDRPVAEWLLRDNDDGVPSSHR